MNQTSEKVTFSGHKDTNNPYLNKIIFHITDIFHFFVYVADLVRAVKIRIKRKNRNSIPVFFFLYEKFCLCLMLFFVFTLF
jgi:hypothetical protein